MSSTVSVTRPSGLFQFGDMRILQGKTRKSLIPGSTDSVLSHLNLCDLFGTAMLGASAIYYGGYRFSESPMFSFFSITTAVLGAGSIGFGLLSRFKMRGFRETYLADTYSKNISSTSPGFDSLLKRKAIFKQVEEGIIARASEKKGTTILFSGESGNGKTYLAEALKKPVATAHGVSEDDVMVVSVSPKLFSSITNDLMEHALNGGNIKRISSITHHWLTIARKENKKLLLVFDELPVKVILGGKSADTRTTECNMFTAFVEEITEHAPELTLVATFNSERGDEVSPHLERGRLLHVFFPNLTPEEKAEALEHELKKIKDGTYTKLCSAFSLITNVTSTQFPLKEILSNLDIAHELRSGLEQLNYREIAKIAKKVSESTDQIDTLVRETITLALRQTAPAKVTELNALLESPDLTTAISALKVAKT